MNDHLVQLITTALSALGGITAAYKAYRVGEQIKEVKISIDGRLEQLLAVTRSDAHAQGLTAGITASEQWSGEKHAAELRSAELAAELLKAEAMKVAEALRIADEKAKELKSQAQVQSAGVVTVTGSPINIIETKDEP